MTLNTTLRETWKLPPPVGALETGESVHVIEHEQAACELLLFLVFEDDQLYPVAHATVILNGHSGPSMDYVEVSEPYRRNGVATMLWRFAERTVGSPLLGTAISASGQGLLDSVNRNR